MQVRALEALEELESVDIAARKGSEGQPSAEARGRLHATLRKAIGSPQEIKELTKQEREIEIATMLSGKKITSSAIKHARELLD